MKGENDLERYYHGQDPHKNLFRYYRRSRNYLKEIYEKQKRDSL